MLENQTNVCALCEGSPNGSRYGILACLGCNVFFRRAVQAGELGRCVKNCDASKNPKSICRSCRLQNCLDAGMDPKAIKHRDKLGPRKHKSLEITSTFVQTRHDLGSLLLIQKKQRTEHKKLLSSRIQTGESVVMMKHQLFRRAGTSDINLSVKIGFQNAIEWANHFEAYWNLKMKEKRLILSEFGISFTLIDQAFKTASTADEGFWLLQNDSFLHSDYFLSIPTEHAQRHDRIQQAKNHYEFVAVLLKQIAEPFVSLQIDKYECVVLKTLLLLTPSFPGKVKLHNSSKVISNCMSELMAHSMKKSSKGGVERFGEIILLMRSIRCAVKWFYNQTKISYLFDTSQFEPYVRGSLIS